VHVICAPYDGPAYQPVTVIPGSVMRWCVVCSQAVWLSPQGQAVAGGEPLCLDCAPGVFAADPGDMMPAPGAAEALQAAGFTDAEMATAFRRVGRFLRGD
jgi:hypothetical protein